MFPIAQLLLAPYNYFGAIIIGAGFALNISSVMLFRKHGTALKPFETSSSLVVNGSFRMSRNPIYLGMLLILFGIAVMLGSLVAFVAPLAMWVTLQKMYIPYEEQIMEETFGQAYRDYKNRVRQWI